MPSPPAKQSMPHPPDLQQIPVTELKGVGPKLAEKLEAIHVHSVLDLLFHLPFRYQDRTRVTPIGSLRHGLEAVIEGEVVGSAVVFGKRRSLLVKVQDRTGITSLRFYHFSAAQKNNLKDGARIRCFGEGRWGKSGVELYHPEYEILQGNGNALADRLTPIYPATEGLHQGRLRALTGQAMDRLAKSQSLPDLLPRELSEEFGFISLEDALHYLHRPPVDASLAQLQAGTHPAQSRLAFEELLAHYLCLRKLREAADRHAAPVLKSQGDLTRALTERLPFKLTSAQQQVYKEIAHDMQRQTPMLRLVQGDVGSGKTLVAVLAALQAVENGYQAAIMAPTEILAEQHYLNLLPYLAPMDIDMVYLSGKIKGKPRAAVLQAMASGQAQVIVGTHALFQDEVTFSRLGLIVVDEQHRFGVHQRLALREKGSHLVNGVSTFPHQLIMTATPIPRTLTMSAYADLDCSIIDELPPGRTPVNTILSPDSRREEIIDRIRNACRDGRQVYWVCTLIEESEALQCQAAEVTFAEMQKQLQGVNIGLIHGRLKPKEKAGIMQAFKTGDIQLLVATTVIEVGVDVPNASLMVIENPERLGLAQLHQLRGRVGRGQQESHCVLLYKAPLSDVAKERLSIMRQSNDGFFIAEKDLEIRGPGEVLGTRQTGLMEFKMADLLRDAHLQPKIKLWSEKIRVEKPDLIEPLITRWLAGSEQYGNV